MRLLATMLAGIIATLACTPNTYRAANDGLTLICFTPPPADWSAAIAHPVASFNGVKFDAAAVDEQHGMVYGGEFTTSVNEVVGVDLSTGKVTDIASLPFYGFAWMVYADGWLAWPVSGAGGWSIQLWNSQTHERRRIPTTGPGAAAIGHGHIAWLEGFGDKPTEIRAYDLSSGVMTKLDSGEVSQPLFAGAYLIWTKRVPGLPGADFVFADAATLQPTAGPPELRKIRDMGQLGGSPDTLVWSRESGGDGWTVDSLGTGTIRVYTAGVRYAQYPQPAGHFLAWLAADRYSIVDLRSAHGFDVELPAGVVATGDTIVVTNGSSQSGVADMAVLHPSQLSALAPCGT